MFKIRKKYFSGLLLAVSLSVVVSMAVWASGNYLENIILDKQNESINIRMVFKKKPNKYTLEQVEPGQIRVTIPSAYLSSSLLKNLDIILDDNVSWKQYKGKLVVEVKHDTLTKDITHFIDDKNSEIIIDIPKYDKTVELEKRKTVIEKKIEQQQKIQNQNYLETFSTKFFNHPQSTTKNHIVYRDIYPGIRHTRIKKTTKNGPLLINVINVAPKSNYYEIIPALANTKVSGKKTVRTIVKENNAIAGVNAGFFKPPTGHPLGTVIIADELISGPIFDRVTFGITRENEYRIQRIHLVGQMMLENGQKIDLDNVNQPRISSSHYLLYSYRWGSQSPPSPPGSKHVAISRNRITAIGENALPIDRNSYVIVGPNKGLFSQLKVGDHLKLKVSTTPDWSNVKHAIGGGPFLVKDGRIFIDKEDQKFTLPNGRAPRTAIGVTKDNHLLLVTVDGRQKNLSIGATFQELASIMLDMGAYQAMNLDGGSSTQMCIYNQISNSPTVSGGNNVSNGLIILPKHSEPLLSVK